MIKGFDLWKRIKWHYGELPTLGHCVLVHFHENDDDGNSHMLAWLHPEPDETGPGAGIQRRWRGVNGKWYENKHIYRWCEIPE